MPEFWTNLSYTTRFSAIGFVVTFILGFISMGFLGLILYYPVSFVLRTGPSINSWHGDWVWPALILVGLGWSFGFLLAGTAWHFLAPRLDSVVILRIIYGLILWAWAAFLWWWVLRGQG